MTLTRRAGHDLVVAARALAPRIASAADEIERERRLPAELVDALVDAGMFKLLVPASLGGAELDLPTHVRVIEELARADASVAWCVGQAGGLCTFAAYMQPETARRIFVETRPGIVANGPGEGNRPGHALPDNGGYQVTGRWNFASGSRHATWLDAICQVEGEPEPRLMFVPIEQATMIDTWRVSGLRGTGSFSFSLTNVFVPEKFSVVPSPRMRRETGPLYLFSSSGVFGPSFGSVALGIAHSALQSFIDFASGKVVRGASQTLQHSQTVQAAVARAQARLTSARLFLDHTLDQVWRQVVETGCLELDQQVRVRLASTNATHEAAAVVDVAYEMAGSSAIFAEHPFERRFRDVHAVTQQLQARAAHFETVGSYLLGLEPDTRFL